MLWSTCEWRQKVNANGTKNNQNNKINITKIIHVLILFYLLQN